MGIEYPKEHEVSDVLLTARNRFPDWFSARVEKIANVSAGLIPKRGLATCGDERRFIPPGKLFSREDASDAMEKAGKTFKEIVKLFKAFDEIQSR